MKVIVYIIVTFDWPSFIMVTPYLPWYSWVYYGTTYCCKGVVQYWLFILKVFSQLEDYIYSLWEHTIIYHCVVRDLNLLKSRCEYDEEQTVQNFEAITSCWNMTVWRLSQKVPVSKELIDICDETKRYFFLINFFCMTEKYISNCGVPQLETYFSVMQKRSTYYIR